MKYDIVKEYLRGEKAKVEQERQKAYENYIAPLNKRIHDIEDSIDFLGILERRESKNQNQEEKK